MNKPRRFDLSPDNFIAGIAGQLSASELGVYWVMCLLFYSHSGAFKYDEPRICALLKGTHWRTVRAASERLHELGKITSKQGQVTVKGCSAPLQEAINRVSRAVENGLKGGRPASNSNNLPEPDGSQREKLARVAPSPSPSPSAPPSIPSKKNSLPGGFAEFWSNCPRKIGKGAAEKAFRVAIRAGENGDVLASAMGKYAISQHGKDPNYIPHPSTWLNQKRWLDEDSGGVPVVALSEEEMAANRDRSDRIMRRGKYAETYS